MAAELLQQLPQLEDVCQRLYTAQVCEQASSAWHAAAHSRAAQSGWPELAPFTQAPQERAAAEQMLRVFGQSTDYIAHCKACSPPGLTLHCMLSGLGNSWLP